MLYFTSLKFLDNLPSDKHQGFKAVHWSKWAKLQSDWSIWNSKVCSSISCCIAGTSSVYFFILSISKIFLTCKPLHWYQRAFRSSQGDRLDFLYKVSYESQWKKEKKKTFKLVCSSVWDQWSVRWFIIVGASLWFHQRVSSERCCWYFKLVFLYMWVGYVISCRVGTWYCVSYIFQYQDTQKFWSRVSHESLGKFMYHI